MKIQTRIILSVCLPILILSMCFIMGTRIVSRNIIQKQIQTKLTSIALLKAKHIGYVLSNYKQTVEILSIGVPFKGIFDPREDRASMMGMADIRIKTTIQHQDDISRIRILNESGIVIVSSHADIGFNKSVDDIFLRGKEGSYIRDIHISKFTGEPVFSAASPIFVRGRFSGVVV